MTRLIPRSALWGALLLLTLGSGSAVALDDRQAGTDPLGLWVWRTEAPNDQVALTITRTDGAWRAEIDGHAMAATLEEGALSVSAPDGQRFVGTLGASGALLEGYWFQPPSDLDYQFVATPVALPAVKTNRWGAVIDIQPRPYHVFLDIFEADGAVSAVIRNPEGNNILRATTFRVVGVPTGGWRLLSGKGEREKQHTLDAGDANTLLLNYRRFNRVIALSPATEEEKHAYYSRVQGSHENAPARTPQKLDDGWPVSSPEDAGFDPETLKALTRAIGGFDPRDRRPQLIHSVLVSRAGRLVYEEYFYGHNREKRHDVRSLGKVFGSVMIGALRQQGHAITTDHRPVASVLKSAGQPLGDKRKADITLAHLMTYTSGLDCDVNAQSAGNEESMWAQDAEPNYWLYTAKLPMLHDPGVRYAYCSGSANLVGVTLSEFGNASVHELFNELIAKPLQFGPYHWALAPNGEGYLGGGAYMRPRDVLKIGAMFAAQGAWNGLQIIDKGWVEESTKARVAISPATTGMTETVFENSYFRSEQAYIWSVKAITVGARRYRAFQASGNGGQLLIVVPELDLAVAISGGNYRMGGIWGRWRNFIVGEHVIPALTDTP